MVVASLRQGVRSLLVGFLVVVIFAGSEEARKPISSDPISSLPRPVETEFLADFVPKQEFGNQEKNSSKPDADEPKTPSAKPGNSAWQEVEKLPFPPGSILVIVKEIGETLRLIPKGVLLTPEKYQALLERIDQLERQAKPPRPDIPSVCKLSGQVEGELVRFQAQFEFKTVASKSQVTLGCQRAWLKPGAALDDKLPMLVSGEDNQVLVQVDNPGIHHLTLELEIPVAVKGPKGLEQGFDFGLPRAAITTLEKFTLPRSIPEVRINGRAVRPKSFENQPSVLEGVPLGPADHLEMVWKGPAASSAKGPPLLEADGLMQIRVTESTLITDVEFNLQVIGGETKEWRIQLPAQVIPEVKEPRIGDDRRIDGIDLPDGKNSILRIRLKEPTSDSLKVVFQIRQGRGKTSSPVGLFPVLNAFRQRGTIGVSAPADLRIRFQLRPDVLQREITEKTRRENAVAEFSYGNLPPSPFPAAPPLEILVDEVKGAIETRVEHTLTLTDQGWKAAMKFLVTPIRTKIDQLELELPPAFQFDRSVGATPAELVESVDFSQESGQGRLVIKFINEQIQPFAFTVPGIYPANREKLSDSLELPKPLKMLDRGGQVTVIVPEGLELVPRGSAAEEPLPGERQHIWRSDRFPARIDVAWRPHRSDLGVASEVDLIMADGQVQVRHKMNLQLTDASSKSVSLLLPAELTDRVRLIQGGTLESDGIVKLGLPAGKDQTLLLNYFFVPPSADFATQQPIPVPLVRVAEATRTETKVRVWNDSRTVPVLLQGPWEILPTEVVADMDTLPSLVLRANGANAPLTLGIKEMPSNSLASMVIDRGLIHVKIAEGGSQTYRVRFLVSRLNSRELDIEFPAPPAHLNAEFFLADKKLSRWQTLESGKQDNETGSVVRLAVEPAWSRKPVLLEIRYQMPRGLTKSGSNWQTTLQPPLPRNQVLLGRIRWQIELPPGNIPVYQGGSQTSEIRWTWSGLLFTPRPAPDNVELERWLVSD
ncbi:MAG TPA: hypothetical protein VGY77_05960, partial [Gemmataceae bacterium]|nr:hypothetical protein [Gemmataceae bacterium]